MTTELGFKVDAAEFDRVSILDEAANLIDAATSHLGPGRRPVESDAGKLTRALAGDEARLPAYPEVYTITDTDFIANHKPQPVALKQLSENFNFYWLRFPIGLRPQVNWGFNMIEARVEFCPDEPAANMRPTAYGILPNKLFQGLLAANAAIEFKLNENLEFEASTGTLAASIGPGSVRGSAGAGGKVKGSAGAVFGPFQYSVKKAKIDHSAVGLEWVFWRLDGAEFFQEDTPDLIVILKAPKTLQNCSIRAELQASRYFNFAAAPLQQAIAQIPAMLRRFFEQGMPLRDEKSWDIPLQS